MGWWGSRDGGVKDWGGQGVVGVKGCSCRGQGVVGVKRRGLGVVSVQGWDGGGLGMVEV